MTWRLGQNCLRWRHHANNSPEFYSTKIVLIQLNSKIVAPFGLYHAIQLSWNCPFKSVEKIQQIHIDTIQHASKVLWHLQIHHWSAYNRAIRKYESSSSFTSDIPLWIEVTNPNSFFDYFKDKFESNDVMLIWDDSGNNEPSNLNEIEDALEWRM